MTAGTTVAPVRRQALLPPIDWLWLILALMLVGYWLFAALLERVDGNVVLASIFLPDLSPMQASAVQFPAPMRLLVEFFHPRVLRHLIPVFIGWWLAVQAAVSLMQVLYNCPDRATAAEFLRRQRRNGVSAVDLPYTVLPHTLDEVRETSILLRVGGPVRVLIPDGHAAVTELNGRFLRVLPPGVHDLGRFEYLLGVVDLQAQRRRAEGVSLLTKEGIPVNTDVGIVFRIDPGENPVTPARPIPFRPEAVKRAAYGGSVDGSGKVSSWDGGALGKVRGALAAEIGASTLDELLAAPSPQDAHHLLVQTVTDKVWAALPKEGIKPLQLYIGRLTPPAEVSQQYTEFWLASQRKEDAVARASGTVELVEQREVARANGEIMMIQAIMEGVRRAQQEAGGRVSGYLLAVRLLEALQQMFRYTSMGLRRAGGDTSQLEADIEAIASKLAGLEERLKLPPPPRFNASRND